MLMQPPLYFGVETLVGFIFLWVTSLMYKQTSSTIPGNVNTASGFFYLNQLHTQIEMNRHSNGGNICKDHFWSGNMKTDNGLIESGSWLEKQTILTGNFILITGLTFKGFFCGLIRDAWWSLQSICRLGACQSVETRVFSLIYLLTYSFFEWGDHQLFIWVYLYI